MLVTQAFLDSSPITPLMVAARRAPARRVLPSRMLQDEHATRQQGFLNPRLDLLHNHTSRGTVSNLSLAGVEGNGSQGLVTLVHGHRGIAPSVVTSTCAACLGEH